MKKTLTQIGTILRTTFALILIVAGSFMFFSPSILFAAGLPISHNNGDVRGQDSPSPNIILADYRFLFWFDDDLYRVQSDPEPSNLIRAQFDAYHGVDPESMLPQHGRYSGDNEVNTSFSSPIFGYDARIGLVSYELSDFSQ